MKHYFKLVILILAVSLYSCGGGGNTEKKEDTALTNPNNPNNPNFAENSTDEAPKEETPKEEELLPTDVVDMENKGVGPITDVTIPNEIDQALATKGGEIYQQKCTACHHPYKKIIGPPQAGVTEKRTPEWIMNMIMNPTGMLQEDPLAMATLEQFNGARMTDQNITEEEARALYEYFRTLEEK